MKFDKMKLVFLGTLVVAPIGLLVPLQASAVNNPVGYGNMEISQVPKNLNVYDEYGRTYVDFETAEDGMTSQNQCDNTKRYYLAPDHPKYDAIYATLLAAELQGNRVVVRFYRSNDDVAGEECIAAPNGTTYASIRGVYLKDY